MDLFLTFITVLAWIVLVISTCVIVLKLFMQIGYSDLQKAIDSCHGFRRNFMHNFVRWVIIAAISWAWIITRYLMGC